MLLQIDGTYYLREGGKLVPESEIQGEITLSRINSMKEHPLCPRNRYFTNVLDLWKALSLSENTFVWTYEPFKWTIAYLEVIPGRSYFTGVLHDGRKWSKNY